MKNQLILKPVNIDARTYDANFLLVNGTLNQNYTNTYYGYCNYFRTQIIFKNINLRSVIKDYDYKDKFNIKLIKIEGIREYNANNLRETIDYQSNLTSNIYIKGLSFLNGSNEVLLKTQRIPSYTNKFICYFSTIVGTNPVQYNFGGVSPTSSIELINFITNNIAQNNKQRFILRTIPGGTKALSPLIEGIVLNFTSFSYTNSTLILLQNVKFDLTDTNAAFTINNNNNLAVMFEFLPNADFNYNFVIPEETNNHNEFTFHKISNSVVDLTIETRDLLSNQIQPVGKSGVSPNFVYPTGIYPSYTYHFEIE
jgi:hypothetical protein